MNWSARIVTVVIGFAAGLFILDLVLAYPHLPWFQRWLHDMVLAAFGAVMWWAVTYRPNSYITRKQADAYRASRMKDRS